MPAVATAPGLPSRLGKYELLLPLAAGGMARIYIGRSTGIGSFERHVVLKLITPERANDHTAVQMFLDEARLAAALNHQNVAQVFEVGEDGGIHYLAMEYVHGQDSRAVLAKAGSEGTRIPLELALTIVAGAAAGLNHAHERRGPDGVPLGIVHRDVSPSNIMIAYDGAVKLLDFGIAKATARSVETQSGIIKGKFAYMAPEQCRGRDVDRRSDVFSLGIILYEISTQHRCFRADSDFDTMHRIVTGDVVRPTRLIPGYPQALEAIVMKALAVDPAQRYQSAGLLLEAIESFAISARMPMSTMALGRFMRDMFGDVSEPWLTNNRGSEPVITKENTISSTNGSGPVRAPHDTLGPELDDGIPEEDARFPDSQGILGRTVLDLPRDDVHDELLDGPSAEWNAKSYPNAQPSLVQNQPLSPEDYPLPPPPPASPPPAMPQGTQPPPRGQFAMNPGSASGSGPSHPGVPMAMGQGRPSGPMGPPMPGQPIVSTRHGYASAAPSRGDISYPRHDAPADAYSGEGMQLRPNRRPLLIGGAIVLVGIIVLLAVSLGGSSKDDVGAPGSDTSAPDEHQMTTHPFDTPKAAPAPTAPSVVPPPVHDAAGEGSDGDASKPTVPVTVPVDDHKAAVKTTVPAVKTTVPVEEHRTVKATVKSAPKTTTEKAAPKQPKCQPPGPNVDPFSSIPVCSK